MEKEKISTEKRLHLISELIGEARTVVSENGKWYMFWGGLTSIITLLVYGFRNWWGLEDIFYYPYFLFPIGGIIQFVIIGLQKRKTQRTSSLIEIVLGFTWAITGSNAMILGFFLNTFYGLLLIPTIYILLGMATFLSGLIIKKTDVWLGGLLINISGLLVVALQLDYDSQLLYMAGISLFGFFGTGLTIYIKR